MKANRQFVNVLYALVRKPDAGSYRRGLEDDSLVRHTLYMGTLNAKKQMVPVKNYSNGWLQKEKIKNQQLLQ